MKTPQEFHERAHEPRFGVPFSECWLCGRDRAKCRGKDFYPSAWAARLKRDELELVYEFDRPLREYRCRWCQRWHLTSSVDKWQAKRGERRRRRWLAKQEEERRSRS